MRSKLQRKIVSAAKKTLDTFNSSIDSSQHSQSLKATNFQIPPPYAKKDVKKQLQEMHGAKEAEYHNEKYAQLMKTVIPFRKEFAKCNDKQAKKQMAKEEFDAWC